MRITGAYSVIETLAQHKNLTFKEAFMYIHNNLKLCDKYQKIAYQVISNDSGLFEELSKEQSV
jgi:hypothetical protein